MRRISVIVGSSLVALAVAGIGIAATAPTALFGSVGPGFSITLRDAQGGAVTRVEPGQFEIEVDDKSEEHNFHLSGPGVDVSTDVAAVGKQTFKVTLANGRYTFTVRDRSKNHNARVRGATATRATGVGFVGTRTWRVVLRKGTLVIQCDPHKATMRQTVRVA